MTTAIIVAAGQGKRMGQGRDKLFLEVVGRPVIAHTWARFDAAVCIDEVILVIRAEREPQFRELAERHGFAKPFRFAVGGAERQDSVWNGLDAADPKTTVVAIHDGARPCVTAQLLEQTINAARDSGAAVAAQRVTDTMKQSADGICISGTVDRSCLWAVQTPQTFRLSVIRKALEEVRRRGLTVTDDTMACELIGQSVRLIEGGEPNPKVTTPGDLTVVSALLGGGATCSGGKRP